MIKQLTDSELSVLAQQLAMLLHAGMPVSEGLSILCEDAESKEGQTILKNICERLDMTGEFAQAIEESGVFPEYFVKMARIGERSGTLDEVMDALGDYYERQDTLRKSIRDSLTYPLILLTMLIAVLIVLITQVMPVFEQVFEQFGIESTGMSAAIFRISHILQNGALLLLIILITPVIAGIAVWHSPAGRAGLLHPLRRIRAVSSANQLLACSRFSDALSLALHSGLDIGEGFSLAADLLSGDQEHSEKLKKASEVLEQGGDIGEALLATGLFTGLNAHLVEIGFRTGDTEPILKKISSDAEREADERINRAVGAIEPTMTAVLSVLTGMLLVSVMLPLLASVTNIG